jgi:hypothetical protein
LKLTTSIQKLEARYGAQALAAGISIKTTEWKKFLADVVQAYNRP